MILFWRACEYCQSWRRGKPGLIIVGLTAESFQALHPPPGVISRGPGPGHCFRAFRLCIHRPATSPDPSRSSAVENESVLGNAPSLFQAASGRTRQLKADQLPRQPGSHRGPQDLFKLKYSTRSFVGHMLRSSEGKIPK